jgi:Protein of unknown function (DUF3040)
MSLSAHDRRVLQTITGQLSGSDPALAALLGIFTRLTAGEQMPEREQIKHGSRRHLSCRRSQSPRGPIRFGRGRRAREVLKRVGMARILILLWLLVAAVLISVAVIKGNTYVPCRVPHGCPPAAPALAEHSSS